MGQVDLLGGLFADIARTEALQYLRERLARVIISLRLHEDVEFDLSMLFMRAPRALSQAISRVVYEDGDQFVGLVCPSRFGAELLNVTLFERSNATAGVGITRASLGYAQSEPLRTNDPDFQEALRKLNLRLLE
jgi:hypothetical protein